MAADAVWSFLFRVDELPTNDSPGRRGAIEARHIEGRWVPPVVRDGFLDPVIGDMYRWKAGSVSPAFEIIDLDCTIYDCATVFYCNDFYKFYTARGWAHTRDMLNGDLADAWHPLSFRHEDNGLSCVDHTGEEKLVIRTATWIDQIIPKAYRARHNSDEAGGLGGLLPILAALVAFSCKDRSALRKVLRDEHAWTDWSWRPHSKTSGRVSKRGLIATVYLDPENPLGSTAPLLEWLEDGALPILNTA